MKPIKKNLLLEQILKKPHLNLKEELDNIPKCENALGNGIAIVFVAFTDGTVIKHERVVSNLYYCETNCYVITTIQPDECFIYRRELVRAVIERKG